MDARVEKFREVAEKRWKYLDEGNSKEGNKCFDELLEIAKELRSENKLLELEQLLNDPSEGVKFEASSKLLTVNSKKAEKAMTEITKKKGSLPFTAKMTLKQWKAGNLKF